MIKAIETIYNGYRFRSRLEARWAVFFDAAGIKYEYEKEGFDLDGIYYLPDFWLPHVADRMGKFGVWVEIKGEMPTADESEKCYQLAIKSGYSSNIFQGLPTHNGSDIFEADNSQYTVMIDEEGDIDAGEDYPMVFHRCSCGSVKIEFPNDYYRCFGCKKHTCTYHDSRLIAATKIAKQARFEHGQTPVV